MRCRVLIILSLAAIMMVSYIPASVSSAGTLRDELTREYKKEGDICPVVKNAIRSGLDTKEVTKTCIEMGHDACLVVRCAVEARGNLEQIITGATEAGATSDVCSRCAMNAGADPKEIARILETGLGYSPVAGGGLTPVEINLPGGNTGGGTISSSHFR
jgi:hypothetical protein